MSGSEVGGEEGKEGGRGREREGGRDVIQYQKVGIGWGRASVFLKS